MSKHSEAVAQLLIADCERLARRPRWGARFVAFSNLTTQIRRAVKADIPNDDPMIVLARETQRALPTPGISSPGHNRPKHPLSPAERDDVVRRLDAAGLKPRLFKRGRCWVVELFVPKGDEASQPNGTPQQVAAANFWSAIDQVAEYDNQCDALDSYRENMLDSMVRGYTDADRIEAGNEFDNLVDEHAQPEVLKVAGFGPDLPHAVVELNEAGRWRLRVEFDCLAEAEAHAATRIATVWRLDSSTVKVLPIREARELDDTLVEDWPAVELLKVDNLNDVEVDDIAVTPCRVGGMLHFRDNVRGLLCGSLAEARASYSLTPERAALRLGLVELTRPAIDRMVAAGWRPKSVQRDAIGRLTIWFQHLDSRWGCACGLNVPEHGAPQLVMRQSPRAGDPEAPWVPVDTDGGA